MKKFLLSILILLLTATTYNPKETYKDTIFYVTDPNGIFLFPDPKDIQNRITVPYKTKLVSLGVKKFSIPSKDNELSEKYFEKLLYKEKIYYAEENKSDKFIKLEPPDSDLYTYTQVKQATIYSLPFKDSKVIKKLPEFSLLEIISHSYDNSFFEDFEPYKFDYYRWSEVKLSNNTSGFILNSEIIESNSLDITEQSLKNKVRDKNGIFQIKVDKPEFFQALENIGREKPIESQNKNYLPKKGMHAQVIRSLEKDKNRYYQIERLNLRHARLLEAYGAEKLKDSEKYFWISEKQGIFFSNEEFTKNSFQESKYKKDSYLLKIFEGNFGGAVNYYTMKLWKYFSKKSNSEFYLIRFQYGIDGNFYYLIIERKANQFKELFVGLKNILALEAQVFSQIVGDMDGDGYPEFIGGYTTRGGGVSEDQLYTFKNGKIKFIANLSDRCGNFGFDASYLSCFSEEETTYEKGNSKKEKKLLSRYKYTKGKLYKEVANTKWEEVTLDVD